MNDRDTPPNDPTLADASPADPDRGDVVDLRAVLLHLGVPATEVDQAASDGTLDLLALETVVSFEGGQFDDLERPSQDLLTDDDKALDLGQTDRHDRS